MICRDFEGEEVECYCDGCNSDASGTYWRPFYERKYIMSLEEIAERIRSMGGTVFAGVEFNNYMHGLVERAEPKQKHIFLRDRSKMREDGTLVFCSKCVSEGKDKAQIERWLSPPPERSINDRLKEMDWIMSRTKEKPAWIQ